MPTGIIIATSSAISAPIMYYSYRLHLIFIAFLFSCSECGRRSRSPRRHRSRGRRSRGHRSHRHHTPDELPQSRTAAAAAAVADSIQPTTLPIVISSESGTESDVEPAPPFTVAASYAAGHSSFVHVSASSSSHLSAELPCTNQPTLPVQSPQSRQPRSFLQSSVLPHSYICEHGITVRPDGPQCWDCRHQREQANFKQLLQESHPKQT